MRVSTHEQEVGKVAWEDVYAATVRVLTAYGYHPPALLVDAAAGVIRSEWVEVEPVHVPALGTARRRHSLRIVLREGVLAFAVDCTWRPAGQPYWTMCETDFRSEPYARHAETMFAEIVAETRRHASWRVQRQRDQREREKTPAPSPAPAPAPEPAGPE